MKTIRYFSVPFIIQIEDDEENPSTMRTVESYISDTLEIFIADERPNTPFLILAEISLPKMKEMTQLQIDAHEKLHGN